MEVLRQREVRQMHSRKWIAALVLSLGTSWAFAQQQGRQQQGQQQAQEAPGKQQQGKVVGMVAQHQNNELVLLDTWSEAVQFRLGSEVKITFENQKMSKEQLKPGTDVAVSYALRQGKPTVTAVDILLPAEEKGIPEQQLKQRIQQALQQAQRQQQPGKVVGMIAQHQDNELVLLDTWSEAVELRLRPDAQIMFEDQRVSMEQLEPGTDVAVSYIIERGEPTITSVEIIQSVEEKGISEQQLKQRLERSLQRAQP